MHSYGKQQKISITFFECSLAEHSIVYHYFQRAMEGGENV